MTDRSTIARTRNVSVVAHVDHGKTTLSDALLTRAHAGNAKTLDNTTEEQERGITINATGISLSFSDWIPRRSAACGSSAQGPPLDAQDPNRSAAIYVGNLPWPSHLPGAESASSSSDEESSGPASHLQEDLLRLFGPHGCIRSVEVRPRRGFAVVTFADVQAADAALQAARPTYNGRALVVSRHGRDPVHQLAAHCAEHSLPAPEYVTKGTSVTVSVGDQQETSSKISSAKEAKRQAAEALLRSLTGSSGSQSSDDSMTADHGGLHVQLVDSPGHADFSAEVTAALRLSDGAIVVVDPVDSKGRGLCPQTETVLRQALQERVRPVLFLNKVDRIITELQMDPEEAYQMFVATIAAVNQVIEEYQPEGYDFTVDPVKGNVAFGSGLQRWGFTLDSFAELLSAGRSADKLLPRLWGDNFKDVAGGKWRSCAITEQGQRLPRGFCDLVLKPIYSIFKAAADNNGVQLAQMAQKLQVQFSAAELEQSAKDIRKSLLQRWLPVTDAVLQMVDLHLPSPAEAQVYRAALLYEGPADDRFCQAMAHCDPAGPLMVYISKLFSASKGSAKNMVAYGRVFSGTVRAGDVVHVCGPAYVPGEKGDVFKTKVQAVVRVMGPRVHNIDAGVAGSVIGLMGIDRYLVKSGTVTSDLEAHRMRVMQFSVSPVVRLAIETERPGDSAKVMETMRLLAKSDPCLRSFVDETTQEKILAGAGELHLEVRLKDLQLLSGVPIRTSDPVVQYNETVTEAGPDCLTKSSNGHNRLFVRAEPLDPRLVQELDAGRLSLSTPQLERVSRLADDYGWTREDARRIVAIEGSNVLVDVTSGISIADIRENVVLGFREVCNNGVLAGEPLQGVRFNVFDAKIHSDSVHRRADQIVPMARRVFSGALLASGPRMMEPIFRVDVVLPGEYVGDLVRVIKKRRGQIIQDEPMTSSQHDVRAFVPVADSFGLSGDLQRATSGRAFPQCSFDHWQQISENPLDAASSCAAMVLAIRARKRLPADKVPTADMFLQKL